MSLGVGFLGCVLGAAFCVVLDNWNAIPYLLEDDGMSIVYYLWNSLQGPGAYGPYLLPVLASLPCALSYHRDCSANIVPMIVEKTGIRQYCVGKMVSTFISGAFVCWGGLWLFALFALRFVPFAVKEILPEFYGFPFYDLLAEGSGVRYYCMVTGLMGLWCGVWACAVLCISAYMQSVYMSLASVVIAQFGGAILLSMMHVGSAYRPDSWFSGTASWCSDGGTVICCLLFTVGMAALLGLLFTRKVRKRLYA